MSVARQYRCLLHKATSISPRNPRRCLSSTAIQYGRRRPRFPSLKQEEMDALVKQLEEKVAAEQPGFTKEQYDALAKYYTPEQMAALKAAEESIDPQDMVGQGFFRRDGWQLDYQDDLSRIHPVIDKPIRGPDPVRDPRIRPKTDEEIKATLAKRIGDKMRSTKILSVREWFVQDKLETWEKAQQMKEKEDEDEVKDRYRSAARLAAHRSRKDRERAMFGTILRESHQLRTGSALSLRQILEEYPLVVTHPHRRPYLRYLDQEIKTLGQIWEQLDEAQQKLDGRESQSLTASEAIHKAEEFVARWEQFRSSGPDIPELVGEEDLSTLNEAIDELDLEDAAEKEFEAEEARKYLRHHAEVEVQEEYDRYFPSEEALEEGVVPDTTPSFLKEVINAGHTLDGPYSYGTKDMDETEKEVYRAMHDPRTMFHAVDEEQLLHGSDVLAPPLPRLDDEPSEAKRQQEGEQDDEEEEDPHMQRLIKQTGLNKQQIMGIRTKTLVNHRVVNQTRMGKIQSLYYLTIAGNENGLLGIGEGKSTEWEDARRQAMYAAIRNMKPIPRYENRTIYGEVKSRVGGTDVILSARPPGFGVRTQSLVFEMARAAGITDLSARVGRSRNKMNTVKATYEALMSQRLPDEVARARGRKMVDVRKVYYGDMVY